MKTEIFGYLSMCVVIASALIKKQPTMRAVNTVSCLMFIIYGFLISSYPIVIMNAVIVVINLYHIYKHTSFVLPCNELLKDISEAYKLINFTDVSEPFRENARQARKKLNKIAGTIYKYQRRNNL